MGGESSFADDDNFHEINMERPSSCRFEKRSRTNKRMQVGAL
jgi:hypothetical protein